MPVRKKRKTTTKKATRATTRGRKTTTARGRSATASRKKTAKTAKKAVSRSKKATTRKTVARKKSPTTAIRTAFNKSQLLTHLADSTELTRKQVSAIFEELGNVMHRHLRKGGAGEFTVPGLLKCVVKRKPATKSRRGVNPFTGEMITFKAKPARNVVKIRTLKRLKEMVK